MKRVKWIVYGALVLVGSLGGVAPAMAEGRCPAGQYPIGGPGWGGCAPIPGGAAPAARPEGRWHDRFGAIALSPSTSKAGTSSGRGSKREARAAALARCEEDGATDCKRDIFVYQNACVVLMSPPAGSSGSTLISTGQTVAEAVASAASRCQQHSSECTVYYQDCSKPVYEKF